MIDIVYDIVVTEIKLCKVGLEDAFAQIEPAGLLDSFGIIFEAIKFSCGEWTVPERTSPPVELSQLNQSELEGSCLLCEEGRTNLIGYFRDEVGGSEFERWDGSHCLALTSDISVLGQCVKLVSETQELWSSRGEARHAR